MPSNRRYDKRKHQRAKKRERHIVRNKVNAIKEENPCTDCGRFFHYSQMQFDHLDADLKFKEIGKMVAERYGWSSIKREINKCELVCANCHMLRTWTRRQEKNGE